MKDGIHPKYQESLVTCGCGNSFTTRSTKPKIMVEVCSKCHPYFTGSVKFVDAAGRVDKFNKKFQCPLSWLMSLLPLVEEVAESRRVVFGLPIPPSVLRASPSTKRGDE